MRESAGSAPHCGRAAKHRPGKSYGAGPAQQALERRLLLAGTPLDFTATGGSDLIQISVSGSNINVRINGVNNLAPIATTSLINVFAGAGDDEIQLDSTVVPISIFGEGGDDDLITTESSGRLTDIAAEATFNGGSDRDFMQLWDDLSPATAGLTYTFENGSMDRQGGSILNFSSVESVDLRAQPGNDRIVVNGISSSVTDFDLYGGFGNDIFELGLASGNLEGLLGPTEVHGETGNDSLILHDRTHTAPATWLVNDPNVSRDGWSGVRYNILESITINAGNSPANNFAVEKTSFFTPILINAGSGDDVIDLAPTSQRLDNVDGAVNVIGEAGNDILRLHDDANPFNDTFDITATTVTRGTFFGGATYQQLQGLRIDAGATPPEPGGGDANVFNVAFTSVPTTLNGGGGGDTFNVMQTAADAPVYIISGEGSDVVNVSSAGPAQVQFAQVEELGELNISAGGVVRLAPDGDSVLITSALTLSGDARLDITDNAAIIDYSTSSPLTGVRDWIGNAYASGAWTGSGITSSSAAADASYAVGYAQSDALFGSFPASFAGRQVDQSAVLIRYTRAGDANLDGTVNLGDFNRLAGSFGAADALWSQGNFNYDNITSLADFNRLAANFGLSAQSPAPLGRLADELLT